MVAALGRVSSQHSLAEVGARTGFRQGQVGPQYSTVPTGTVDGPEWAGLLYRPTRARTGGKLG